MKFFKTTYQECDDEDEAHLKYQLEFLRIFEIKSYDDDAISKQLDTFYEEVQSNEEVMEILNEQKEKNNCKTTNEALSLLFSWENLYRVADIICHQNS